MRGNVETRLRKLEDGVADATLLACAGLNRLGLADRITSPVPTEQMLPAVAQGAIGIETRADDMAMAELLAPVNHEPTALAVTAERAFLARLEGSCRTPIAGLAELAGGRLVFRGMILTPDGRQCYATRREGRPEEALTAGRGRRRRAAGQGRPRLPARARLMRLLVTRPEPDALKLRAALEELGHEATVEPLLSVSFEDADAIDLDGVQALIATSRNALRALKSHPALGEARKLPLFAVGKATAEEARALGFEMVVTGAGTAQELVAHIVSVVDPAAGLLLHLAGDTLAGDLEGELESHGFRVLQPVVYRMQPAKALSEDTVEQLAMGEIDGVILMSPRTAAMYATLMRKQGLVSVARGLVAFLPVGGRGSASGAAGRVRTEIAEAPRLEEVLALIDAAAAQSGG